MTRQDKKRTNSVKGGEFESLGNSKNSNYHYQSLQVGSDFFDYHH